MSIEQTVQLFVGKALGRPLGGGGGEGRQRWVTKARFGEEEDRTHGWLARPRQLVGSERERPNAYTAHM